MSRFKDLLINVAAPLLAGLALYICSAYFTLPAFIKSFAADALWAYALMSGILIIWGRHVSPVWAAAAFAMAAAFEVLQHYNIVSGTGDVGDVIVYFSSFTTALIINPLIKRIFYQNSKKHAII